MILIATSLATPCSSFSAFKSAFPREPDTGLYIWQGDIAIPPRELRSHFQSVCRSTKWRLRLRPKANIDYPLETPSGRPRSGTWPADLANAIHWCADGVPASLAEELTEAASSWNAALGVQFEQVDCDESPLFRLREAPEEMSYYARAFFPAQHDGSSALRVHSRAAAFSRPVRVGILRHELGHVLGFRHEALWGDSPCHVYEARPARRLGAHFDPDSVMNHFLCGGQRELTLSICDVALFGQIYPPGAERHWELRADEQPWRFEGFALAGELTSLHVATGRARLQVGAATMECGVDDPCGLPAPRRSAVRIDALEIPLRVEVSARRQFLECWP